MDDIKEGINEHEFLESQITLEQIRLLYGSLKFSLGASFSVAIIMYFMLRGHSDSATNLNIWIGAVFVIFLFRTIDALYFLSSPQESQEQPIWHLRFLTGALCGGILWGMLAWLGHSSKDEFQALIVMSVVGVCAGSLSSLAFSWRALVIFFTPATVLLAANLFLAESEFSKNTAVILAFFILFTLMSGKRIFNNTYQNIRLRIEADNREIALELMHQKQLLHSQQTPLAVIEFDLELDITDWNKAAETIFGYKKIEALGNNILKLIVPESSMKQVEELWDGVLKLKPVIGEAIENHTKDRSSIVCEWYITPLTKHDNNIVGIAAMALNITDKKHFEEELVSARDESDRANQAKSDFLSNMSHELRTPLNAILGFTQLLNTETTLDDKQKDYVNEINSAGQLQLELINQILDLARIEEGYLNLSIEKVSVDDVINECAKLISPLANQSKISLDFDCNPSNDDITQTQSDGTALQCSAVASVCNSNAYVKADYTRLKQVIINLLANAIKYNNVAGSVKITCSHKENNRLRINITDTGKGIPEELKDDIFKPFNRLGVGHTIEGTGIGLSISKQLIEKMGGNIGVDCSPETGSTFWIELDSCTVSDSVATDRNNLSPSDQQPMIDKGNGKDGIRILVAEDNPINQTLILNQLNSLGYEVDLVSNGNEALKLLDKEHYDLLLTDCNMPVMDGYELSREIRKKGNDQLSIIAITADAFPEREEECLKAGMNARITKPVDLDSLNSAINKQLN